MDSSVETVMGILEHRTHLANACLVEYNRQCEEQNGAFYGVEYNFVERLYEYVKYAPLVLTLKRAIREGKGARKRIRLEDECPMSCFLGKSAPVEVVQTVMNFLGFYPKLA